MIKNLDKIHILKRKLVYEICKTAASSDIVKRIIVFGSAITDKCTEDSDVDICVDIDCDDKDMRLYTLYINISKTCEYNCDILNYRKLGSDLKRQIDKNGIVVYNID
jgi:Predicted nucleotidyltransferases